MTAKIAKFIHLILFGFLIIAVAIAFYAFYYAKGTAYLSNNPSACVNCHVMNNEYNGWVKSSHHLVATCNDCHVPQAFFGKYITKMENGYHHSKAFTFMDFHEPIKIREKSLKIVLQNCQRCHSELFNENSLHAIRTSNSQMVVCTHCHKDSGHLHGD